MSNDKNQPKGNSQNQSGNGSKTNPNFGDRIIKGDNPNLPTFKNPPPPPKKK